MRTKWTYEMLSNEALKYNTRVDFKKGSPKAYDASRSRKILDNVCSHMIRLGNLYKRYIYTIEFENNSVYIGLTYNLEKRKSEHMLKSSNKYVKELIKDNISFSFSSDNILYSVDNVSEIELNLIKKYEKSGYNVLNIAKGGGLGARSIKWTNEVIKKEALKYNTRSDFEKHNKTAYNAAHSRGIFDDVCSHMTIKLIKWTEEMLKEEALKYNNRSDFQSGNSGAYKSAIRKGILNDVCSHMIYKLINWDEKMIRKEALKYNTRNDFKNGSNAYRSAQRKGILDDVCSHMKNNNIL